MSAIDVVLHLKVLKANIMLRKDEMYLDPQTERERSKLIETDEYDETMLNGVFDQFYGVL